MSRSHFALAIAVTSDHALVAEAVSAALNVSDLDIVRLPWADTPAEQGARWRRAGALPGRALMLCDLEWASLEVARAMVSAYPSRWLLLTGAPRGPLWGAMLEAGVHDILEDGTTLADLMEAIATSGSTTGVAADRRQLVEAWRRDRARRADIADRMRSLTPRELEVLRLLQLGRTVPEIAAVHEVASSTVRSQVRSTLRKLRVHSQLAATAVLAEAQGS